MVNTPVYYINNFPTVTGDASSVKNFLVGVGADILIESLSKRLKVFDKPTILNFLSQNVASEFVSQTVEVALNPTTGQFKVNGEVIVDVIGETATDAAVKAILTALGVGTGIVGITIGAVASEWIWDALSEETGGDEAITSFIDDVIQYVRGPVPIDIQIVDTNGNVLAGALYEEDIDETTEYEAITLLIQQSQISSVIPQLAVGANRIRVVEKTIISPQVREYRLYNGALVDEISQTFNISKYNLLFLGTKNEPNWNGQIYVPLLFGESPFLFGSTDHQFFVPLPDTNGNIQPVGLYLGDIIVGTDSEDRLDAFQVFRERVGLDRSSQKQKVLLLGLDGDDIIDGNVDDDFIVGGEGNDTIDGKGGTDIAIFSDDFENYEPSLLADGNTVFSHVRGTQTDGVDTLRGIEFAQFRDRIVLLPLEERSPQGRTVVPALPQLVKDIFPGIGNSFPGDNGFIVFNNALYFQAFDPINGAELWKVDSSGTVALVRDINPGSDSSNPSGYTVFNNALYFQAFDGTNGKELWRVDSSSTVALVRDINPGRASSDPFDLTVFNNTLYFSADIATSGGDDELWKVDSNGTAALVSNIRPNLFGSNPSGFTAFNNALYFRANDGNTGTELWKLDSSGTPSLVRDINLGGDTSLPSGFTVFNNTLYFQADDGTTGYELWKVDSSGTVALVKDIKPTAGSFSLNGSFPNGFTIFNNALYFSANDGTNGYELWKVDSNGTVKLVRDIQSGVNSSNPNGFTVFNNALYFEADDGINGTELWKVDSSGTAALVSNINPSNNSNPFGFTVFNNALYFNASDGTNGSDLWRLDSSGTVARVSGSAVVNPSGFTVFNNALYFQASDINGTELWRFSDDPIPTPAPIPTPTPEPSGDDRSDTLIGTNSNDLITGTPSNEIIVGKLGNDSLFGRSGNDLIYGNQGEDVLNGNQGNDTLYGGKGNDVVCGGKDNDLVSGDLGDDTLLGDLGNDTLYGRQGNDLLNGNQGEDVLNGNQGNDTVYGGKDNDVVHGGKDDDLVSGDLGNDTLFGDLGNDTVRGGAGDDLLSGGVGNDSLIGGEGRDRFVLTSGAGVDTISDFQTGQDLMGLAGGLRFEQLTISQGTGIKAQDTLILIATTGELLASLTDLSSSSLTQDMFALV